MKRIFALLLIFVMIVSCFIACGDDKKIAGKESSAGLEFKLNKDEKSYTLVGIGTCEAQDVIVDYYQGYPVTEIARNAMSRCDNIKTLTIGDAVTFVGEMSFYSCKNLNKVTFGKGVNTIGKNAFEKCTSLESVVIPDGIKVVPMRAFSGCASLKSVTLGKDVEEIKSGAFEYCASLCTITIPEKVVYIRDNSFLGCNNLVEVINHSKLEFTRGSEKNGRVAYYALKVHTGESELVYKDDFIFYSAEKTNYLVKYLGDKADITLPDDYNGQPYVISPYAFADNTTVSSVTFGEKVAGVGKNAFEGATSLDKVIFNSDLAAIGAEAFMGCVALEAVEIPDSVIGTGINLFKKCTALKRVNLGNGLDSIGEGMFSGCSALESLIIPENIKKIGVKAFENCDNLISVEFKTKDGWKAGDENILAEDKKQEDNQVSFSTEFLRKEIATAIKVQKSRQGKLNARLLPEEINYFCKLDKECNDFMNSQIQKYDFSARGVHSCIKLARTIADLAGSAEILPEHISEAISYRSLDRFNRGGHE